MNIYLGNVDMNMLQLICNNLTICKGGLTQSLRMLVIACKWPIRKGFANISNDLQVLQPHDFVLENIT